MRHRKILRRLCEIIVAYVMTDHIHMLSKESVSVSVGFLKRRSAVLSREKHGNLKYKYGNRIFWSKIYYDSTVELNQKTIQKYIREQEADDRARDSISKREYIDPFKKYKVSRIAVGSFLGTLFRGYADNEPF